MTETEKIIKRTKCLVLDMDGTIYLDSTPIGDMINTLKKCRDKGIKIYYFTNNSSKNYIEYVKKLSKIGFYDDRDEVYTSAMATISFLNANFASKKVYVLATDEVIKSFVEGGVNVVNATGEEPDVALMCYDTTINFEKMKRFNEYLVKGAVYIATHPDFVCPTAGISMPDVGSFIKMFEATSGRTPDYVIGKPNSIAGGEIVRKTGLNPDEITMVGDRLYTDIKFGVNSKFNTILVLSGETTVEDLKVSDVKPDIVFNDLNEIVKYL